MKRIFMIKPKDLKRMIEVDLDKEELTEKEKENQIITFLNSEMLVWYVGEKGICPARTHLNYFNFYVTEDLCCRVAQRFVDEAGWDKVYYKIDKDEEVLHFIFIMDKSYDEYFESKGYKIGATKVTLFDFIIDYICASIITFKKIKRSLKMLFTK